MSALREAAQQALEALMEDQYLMVEVAGGHYEYKTDLAIGALKAALAQEQAEPDLSRCPQCNGPADNGFDRSIPPNPYLCTKCMAEPLNLSDRAVQRRLAAQWGYVPAERAEPDLSRCPQCNGPADNGHDRSIPPSPYLCTKCMAEPAQEPVTTLGYAARKIEELIAQRDALLETLKYIDTEFRKHGRQHWPEAVRARAAAAICARTP